MQLSVEIEPPHGIFNREDESKTTIYDEVLHYVNHINMISITNRPVFGLSPLTMASQVHKLLNRDQNYEVRVNLHLTTRLTHFDTFKYVLDAHRVGISDLLPILGDPRGPDNPNYFKNGFEILGFVSYLQTGNEDFLSDKYMKMLDNDDLVPSIDDAGFNVGSVVDVNPTKHLSDGKTIDIRDRQIRFARKKEKLGADYLISQAFFNPDYYFDFIDEAELDIPILAGVIPARSKLISKFGLPISDLKMQRLRAQFTTKEEKEIGNEITKQVFDDLIERGCKYTHIYTIGNYHNFTAITGIDIEETVDGTKDFDGYNTKVKEND